LSSIKKPCRDIGGRRAQFSCVFISNAPIVVRRNAYRKMRSDVNDCTEGDVCRTFIAGACVEGG